MWSFREKLVGEKFYRSIGVITLLCINFNIEQTSALGRS